MVLINFTSYSPFLWPNEILKWTNFLLFTDYLLASDVQILIELLPSFTENLMASVANLEICLQKFNQSFSSNIAHHSMVHYYSTLKSIENFALCGKKRYGRYGNYHIWLTVIVACLTRMSCARHMFMQRMLRFANSALNHKVPVIAYVMQNAMSIDSSVLETQCWVLLSGTGY